MDWVDKYLYWEPVWLREPSIACIATVAERHFNSVDCKVVEVSTFSEGCFNKLYKVRTDDGLTSLMRVTLPVCPKTKTSTEVATLRWLGLKTSIPVPEVLAFDTSADNEIGFEWILMTMMPGKNLRENWRDLSVQQKEGIVKQLAGYQSQLLKPDNCQSEIGGLLMELMDPPSAVNEQVTFSIGPMAHLEFFKTSYADLIQDRGPYPTTAAWYEAWLDERIRQNTRMHDAVEDPDDRPPLLLGISIAHSLKFLLSGLGSLQETEPSVLWHHDLHQSNILIDEEGNISAIVDWECAVFGPKSRAYRVPTMLEEPWKETLPLPEDYRDAEEDEINDSIHKRIDLQGKCPRFGEDYLNWEALQLRRLYRAELERLCPRTAEEIVAHEFAADLEDAIFKSGNEMSLGEAIFWIEDIWLGLSTIDLRKFEMTQTSGPVLRDLDSIYDPYQYLFHEDEDDEDDEDDEHCETEDEVSEDEALGAEEQLSELQRCEDLFQSLPDDVQAIRPRYRIAVEQGTTAAVRFTFKDEAWKVLEDAEKELLVRLSELEHGAATAITQESSESGIDGGKSSPDVEAPKEIFLSEQ